MPVVSVVMPTYNQASYIAQAIRSVQAQTFTDWELIIIDDGSVDNTKEVVSEFVASDPRLRYIYQDNQERSRSRNNGIRAAVSALTAFLDGDDFWDPGYLAKQIANLEKYPDAGFSFTRWYDTDEMGQVVRIRGGLYPEYQTSVGFLTLMLIGNRIGTPSCVLARTVCLKEAGLFKPELSAGEDWDLWLCLVAQFPVAALPEPLVYYRHYNILLPERYTQRGFGTAHVRIAQEGLAKVTDPELLKLKPQILGRAYWYSAWMQYAVGDTAGGQQRLTQAYEVWPELFSPPYQYFIETVAYFADELYDLKTPLPEALKCINRVFSNLPGWAKDLQTLRNAALGQYYGLHVFRSFEQRDWDSLLPSILSAVRYQSRWLANRGFVSIALQTMFPPLRR